MSDLLKVKVGGSSYLCKWNPDFVVIGGRKYKTVTMPDGKIWMAENLDYKWTGLDIGPSGLPSTQAAWYYNNDEATYGIDGTYKCGLIYNWYAIKYLDDNKTTLLPSGWHVPTVDEFQELIVAVDYDASKLKALDDSVLQGFPSGWGGVDAYGYKALPAGGYDGYGNFNSLGIACDFYTLSEVSSSRAYFYYIGRDGASYPYEYNKTSGYSLRLVKDTT